MWLNQFSQGDAHEKSSRTAAGDVDAFGFRVFRSRPDGAEHGEPADGDGEYLYLCLCFL